MFRIGGQIVPPKTVFLIASESLLIFLGLVLGALATFTRGEAELTYLLNRETLARFALVMLVCELSMYYHDVYDLQFVRRRSVLFVQLLQAFGVASVLLGLCYYVRAELSPGRGITMVAAPTIVILICAWRLLLDWSGVPMRGPERMLIMGTGEQGIMLAREILGRPEFKIDIAGFLDEQGQDIGKSLVNPGIIGATWDVEKIASRERADRIVLCLKERRGITPVRELLRLKFGGVMVEDAHSVFERLTGRILLNQLSPSAFILSEGFRKSSFLTAAKRSVDIIFSATLLLLTAPVIALVALAIWLESGGPVLFRQERVGLSGIPFEILKFRSMYHRPAEAQPSWTADGDKRITRVGRFIRAFRVDELPQLWNVLRGEMSLVGPRPEQPYFCELLEAQIPFYGLRHTVRPGITGWAQVKYNYGASVEDARRKLELDLFYIKHLSLSLDMAIVFETVKVVLLGRGAK